MWREKGLNVRNNGYFVITEFPIFIVDVMNYHPWKQAVSCPLSVEESACSIEMKIEGVKERRKKREGKSPIQILALDLTRAQITFCVNTRAMIKMKYMSGSSILNNEYLHSFSVNSSVFCRVFQADCPDGKLYKSKIIDMYAMIIPRKNASILVDHIFRVFDKDSNGFIDFRVNWK